MSLVWWGGRNESGTAAFFPVGPVAEAKRIAFRWGSFEMTRVENPQQAVAGQSKCPRAAVGELDATSTLDKVNAKSKVYWTTAAHKE